MFAKLTAAWQRSRTLFVAKFIMLAALVLQAADAAGGIDLAVIIPPKYAPVAPFLTALLFAWLRKITTGPVPAKEG
jgi:hypothetical protein